MPIFDKTGLTSRILAGNHYGYSGMRIDRLGASEYTLVAIAADVSGSVSAFKAEIEACIQETVRACRHSPRADNLMLRLVAFDDALTEVHGFKPLIECKPADYKGALTIGGTTALYDAAHNAVASVTDYGRDLVQNGLSANAIAFVITDGGDNASTLTARSVKDAIAAAVSDEAVESIVTVLVGVNVSEPGLAKSLMDFSAAAGFDHYLELDKADAATLARLADFLSRSIAAQSKVLGSGGPSQVLTF
ncbi:MAG: hypothetical protein H6737_02225 [Alphaproteobacteria bacterium]|nr:hypothetical protein [Alphaproteobacteria bacterium]